MDEELKILMKKLFKKIKSYFLGKSYDYPQYANKENWYSNKNAKFSQFEIKESVLRHGSYREIGELISLSSYYEIKNILFESGYYKDTFEMSKWPKKLEIIYDFLKLKMLMKDQGILPIIINVIIIGKPKSWWRFKLKRKIINFGYYIKGKLKKN